MKNNIQKMRWERDWSLRELSAKSGVSRAVINRLENDGEQNSTIQTAFLLANAFGISVEELFN